MDREILFRGKRTDTKEWVYGYIVRVHHRGKKGKIESYFFNALDELGWSYECVVSAETVCQYTGLNDSMKWEELSEGEKEKFLSELNHIEDRMNAKEDWNGRKIFEGDIVDRKVKFPEIVVFHDGDWVLDYSYASGKESGYNYCNLGFYAKERGGVKVIGNIFDNPELLEGGAE